MNNKNIYWIDSQNLKYKDIIQEDITKLLINYNEIWLNSNPQHQKYSITHQKFIYDIEYMCIKSIKIQSKQNLKQPTAINILISNLNKNIQNRNDLELNIHENL